MCRFRDLVMRAVIKDYCFFLKFLEASSYILMQYSKRFYLGESQRKREVSSIYCFTPWNIPSKAKAKPGQRLHPGLPCGSSWLASAASQAHQWEAGLEAAMRLDPRHTSRHTAATTESSDLKDCTRLQRLSLLMCLHVGFLFSSSKMRW